LEIALESLTAVVCAVPALRVRLRLLLFSSGTSNTGAGSVTGNAGCEARIMCEAPPF